MKKKILLMTIVFMAAFSWASAQKKKLVEIAGRMFIQSKTSSYGWTTIRITCEPPYSKTCYRMTLNAMNPIGSDATLVLFHELNGWPLEETYTGILREFETEEGDEGEETTIGIEEY